MLSLDHPWSKLLLCLSYVEFGSGVIQTQLFNVHLMGHTEEFLLYVEFGSEVIQTCFSLQPQLITYVFYFRYFHTLTIYMRIQIAQGLISFPHCLVTQIMHRDIMRCYVSWREHAASVSLKSWGHPRQKCLLPLLKRQNPGRGGTWTIPIYLIPGLEV